jgi:antitoxin component of RelBE/YafQ-DinJ toxin-antitoxin module
MEETQEQTAPKAVLNMQLDADLLSKAKALAKRKGISLSGLIRMLLIDAVNQ